MPALDYSRLADLYDLLVPWKGDVRFFRERLADVDGPVLELMAGTGRLLIPLAEALEGVVGVDASSAMLARLDEVRRRRELEVGAVAGDVRALPFGDDRFGAVLLGFQGFGELVGPEQQRAALAETRRVLRPSGTFLCTMHNPPVRLRTVTGEWLEAGRVSTDSGEVTLELRTTWFPEEGIVRGQERIRRLDGSGEERVLNLEFGLPDRETAEELLIGAGFRIVGLVGDYEGREFDPRDSPVMIWTLRPGPDGPEDTAARVGS